MLDAVTFPGYFAVRVALHSEKGKAKTRRMINKDASTRIFEYP